MNVRNIFRLRKIISAAHSDYFRFEWSKTWLAKLICPRNSKKVFKILESLEIIEKVLISRSSTRNLFWVSFQNKNIYPNFGTEKLCYSCLWFIKRTIFATLLCNSRNLHINAPPDTRFNPDLENAKRRSKSCPISLISKVKNDIKVSASKNQV